MSLLSIHCCIKLTIARKEPPGLSNVNLSTRMAETEEATRKDGNRVLLVDYPSEIRNVRVHKVGERGVTHLRLVNIRYFEAKDKKHTRGIP